MPREKKVPEEDEGVDESWLASWADGMTLLMAFFVMLYAFALVDLAKFQDFKVGIAAALGVEDATPSVAPSNLDGGEGIAPGAGMNVVSAEDVAETVQEVEELIQGTGGTVTPESAEEVRDLLEQRFEAVGAGGSVMVEIDERGIVVRFPDRLLFQSGQAYFDNQTAPIVLSQISQVLATVENSVDIEGHTDDVPTGRLWPSNWELSGARASAVVRWFHEFGKVPEVRMAAVGLSDTHPRASNATEDGRAANRRVEVVIRIDGMTLAETELIEAIEADVIGEGFLDSSADGSAVDSTDNTGTDSASDAAETPMTAPVEIDPVQTGLES